MPARRLPFAERDQRAREGFWKRVHKTNGCWLWTGSAAGDTGYGLWSYFGKAVRPHRLSWIFEHGPIPAGMYVCHRCDVRLCVRPSHLFLGTHAENMRDASRKGRFAGRPIHRGEASASSRITEADVVAARRGKLGTPKEIAERLGVSVWAVYELLSARTWAHVKTPTSAKVYTRESRSRQKLSADSARAIRARYAEGERPVDLAKEFGISPSTVSNIGAGRVWKGT